MTTACAICEHGPPEDQYLCDNCSDAPGQVRALMGLHPDHAGAKVFILVPKGDLPNLAKAIPMDANFEGRKLEGAPVSAGAWWDTREDAQAALERWVPADVRATLEVREVALYYLAPGPDWEDY